MAAILILLVVLVLNGALAMAEIALVSARKPRLEKAAAEGHRGAAAALKLASSPTRMLSTVQVGITLIGIFAGAFGEASLARDFERWIEATFGWAMGYGREIAIVAVVLSITYVSLVVGELAPKRLAMIRPEAIASLASRPMSWLSLAASPVVAFLTFSTDLLLRLAGVKPGSEPDAVTQEDVSAMIAQGTEAGVIEAAEERIVSRVFDLGDRTAVELMVPRSEVVWLDASASAERIRVIIATESHSHFPVARGGLDTLVGVVHVKDLVKNGLLSESVDLSQLAREPVFVPETTSALDLLEVFESRNTHLAFVVDEHGVLEGLVTLNDVVTRIIGEVARLDEGHDEELLFRREDGSWLADGRLPVEELGRLLGREPDSSWGRTLGGFVLSRLGRIPRAGDRFTWEGTGFEVLDMDRQRVDKVLVSLLGDGRDARRGSDRPEDLPPDVPEV